MTELLAVIALLELAVIAVLAVGIWRVSATADQKTTELTEQAMRMANHAIDTSRHIAESNSTATVELVEALVTPPPTPGPVLPAQTEPAPTATYTDDDLNAGYEIDDAAYDPFDDLLPDAHIRDYHAATGYSTPIPDGPIMSGQVWTGTEGTDDAEA